MTRQKNAHCSYCGVVFGEGLAWPRTCAGCTNISYQNPLPVAVALLPVDGGLLCIRRDIEPARGKVALPGGFLDVGETWQEGCVRELREETGIVVAADEIVLFQALSAVRQNVLVLFGLAKPRSSAELPAFAPNDEISERLVLPGPIELAFPLHTQVMKEYFERRG
jgi:ADP-ribose pyrophosphatase YjhB (NUDIX family)